MPTLIIPYQPILYTIGLGASTDCTDLISSDVQSPVEHTTMTDFREKIPSTSCSGDPMQSNTKKGRRGPKRATTTQIIERVELKQNVKAKKPRKQTRSNLRSFQQPNPSSPPKKQLQIRNRGRNGDVANIPGNDLVATISSGSSGLTAGTILVNMILNPETMGLPRLSTVSHLYRRYRIASMEFLYEPTATIEPGSLLGYVDYEPYSDPSDGTALQRLQRVRASYGEKGINITNPGKWTVVPMKEPLFIHSEMLTSATHWQNYARFVLYANSDIAANKACGTVIVRYNVEFLHPSYEIPAAVTMNRPHTYFWWDEFDHTSAQILESTVDTGSDLNGFSVTTPSSGTGNTLIFPYDAKDDVQNYYYVSAALSDSVVGYPGYSSVVGCNIQQADYGTPSGSGSSMITLMIHVTAEPCHFVLGFGLPMSSCTIRTLVTRIRQLNSYPPKWKKPLMLKDSKESKESKELVLESDVVVVPKTATIQSQSSSSLGSGSVSSRPTPTPLNTPTNPGWFRS